MILFLDFDGVLHPMPGKALSVFCRLELLEVALARHPHVKIMVSSSWRETYPQDVLHDMLGDLGPRFIGVTPLLKASRHCEILAAMEAYPGIPYIILDDDALLFKTGCPQLLLCNPSIGLDEETIAELDRRIQAAGESC